MEKERAQLNLRSEQHREREKQGLNLSEQISLLTQDNLSLKSRLEQLVSELDATKQQL
jgi:hypothetical protein